MAPRKWLVAALATALVVPLIACSSNATATSKATLAARIDLSKAGPAPYEARGSVGQVWLENAQAGQALKLIDPVGHVAQKGVADAQGSYIFRDVTPAVGYRVVSGSRQDLVESDALTVTSFGANPPHRFYAKQKINDGYGYLTTRDGTQLAITVKLPGPIDKGPYPTVIEYSGYSPADPDSPQPSELIASVLGYATVGINIRGTGCSGGAFSFFEPLQSTDGYDAVETIAAQPWVAFHKVGMVGISYPGISQLFVAQTDPPHLAAIAPLSVIDDTARGTLDPGGIFNDGFALSWAKERQHDAQAAPASGQAWAGKRIQNGDQVCAANQKLRSQAPDILQQIEQNQYWTDAIAAPLAPELFVHKITVPTFLAGSWQDEQTGGYAPNLFDHFTGVKHAYFTETNGNHTDPLGPSIFQRWYQFLSIYVARKVPVLPPAAQLILAGVGSSVFGTSDLTLPPDQYAGITSFSKAKRLFEHTNPRVRILLDNGAGKSPGVPAPSSELDFASWPVKGTTATPWYFGTGGTLVPSAPKAASENSYRYDPSNAQVTTVPDGAPDSAIWGANAVFNWPAPNPGTALAYESAPLTSETVMAGNASVDLWLKSNAADTDLQVTLAEVRPDGKETYIQNGWLRASDRALAKDASELRPVHPFTKGAAKPLPAGEFVLTRVEMFPFAHVFRAGSKIRIIIDAPGGTRPRWKFQDLPAAANQTNTVSLGGRHASRVVLPVIEGITPPATPLPPCPGLRGEPCRTYAPIANGS